MEQWFILNEFILLIYFIWSYIESGIKNSTFIVLLIIVYIILKMSYYIYKREKYKKVILIIIDIVIVLGHIYIDKNIIVFLPINIYMLIETYNIEFKVNILIIILTAFFVCNDIVKDFIVSAGFSFILYYSQIISSKKINKLIIDNDKLKEANFILSREVSRKKEFEKQLKDMSQLEERNKIAQEIHDKVGHTISGSLMQLEAAKLLMDKDLIKSKVIIENIINVLRLGMDDIRKTLRSIKPSIEQMGINKIKLLIESTGKNSNIDFILLYSGSIEKILFKQWSVIYDNVNECLTNAIKYSKATKITVNIQVLNKIIKVEIRDNGIGSNKIIKGMGLLGIEERTEKIGGKIVLDSSTGFSVITLIPI